MDGDGDQQDPLAHHDSPPASAGPNTPSGARSAFEQPPTVTRRRRPVLWAVATLVAAAVVGTGTWAVARTAPAATVSVANTGTPATDPSTARPPIVAAQPVSEQALAALPMATTFSTVTVAPKDPSPDQIPSGRLVHPLVTVPAYASPGGPAIAAVPAEQVLGVPAQPAGRTALPVVAEQPGWAEVLLPTRPNDSAAWIVLDDRVVTEHTPYRIEVDRAHFALTLFKDGAEIGRWTVGIGKPQSPTPATRTMILASIQDTHPTFSPIILATGAHSDTYTSYGGGPGTVGLHGWPSASVFGQPSSDGCVRIPADALQTLSTQVPIGTPVLIR